jgi:hypothetical protein
MKELAPVSPNKSLQRSVNLKVLGRGRVVPAPLRAPRGRVQTSQPLAAEFSRYATGSIVLSEAS